MPGLQQSQAETTMRCCSEIVRRLLEAHDKGESVNLNALKTQVAKKYGAKVVPRLVDIISAVPQDVRDILLPKLRAKPVRTASGVRPFPPAPLQRPLECAKLTRPRLARTDRRRRRHEQAAPVPAHRHDRQHLRVRPPPLYRLVSYYASDTDAAPDARAGTAQEGPTRTLSTRPSPTLCVLLSLSARSSAGAGH
mgnify:CR=1 FL=1